MSKQADGYEGTNPLDAYKPEHQTHAETFVTEVESQTGRIEKRFGVEIDIIGLNEPLGITEDALSRFPKDPTLRSLAGSLDIDSADETNVCIRIKPENPESTSGIASVVIELQTIAIKLGGSLPQHVLNNLDDEINNDRMTARAENGKFEFFEVYYIFE